MALDSLSSFLKSGLGPSSVIPGAPGFSSSSSAQSAAGPSQAAGGWQQTGAISFGGSGTGGATVGGPAAITGLGLPGAGGVNTLLAQYWPLLAVVGVVWIARRRKSR
jgi:hypothetical protein